ncbi:phosphatidylinositol 4-kinase [Strigomonas culicis]|uniref:Phosphatidylinositol 4-kinase n=1 Tax=Strigomonas culicis TaxID=28005 RepID=S9TQ86_9TRYP|nr:phosphatidylinositol 4-kinase [Strigomonas culicis]|eukprot:EPY18628.1 phosphatidylinositol 4-kinase [Strigomonas culicis]
MKRAQERHELLETLQTLSSSGSSHEERLKLVAKLFQSNLNIIEDCMLQVTHVCITQPHPEIQQHLSSFLHWLAGNSLMLALKLSWTIDAITDFFISSGMSDQIKKIHDRIETVAINQDRQLPAPWDRLVLAGAGRRAHAAPLTREDRPDADVVMRKEQRLKLYNDERAFVSFLTDLSNQLRFFPDRSKRKVELRKRLAEVNEHLASLRLVHPLCRSNDHVRWIVHIAVEECTVFSSRERAPYLIRYEVVVDDTATLADPSQSRLRQKDGSFKVSSASQDVYVPGADMDDSSSSSGEEAAGGSRSRSRSSRAGAAPPNEALQSAFGESAEERHARIRRESPWGAHPNWSMNSMIVKAGDDLRQEELALQLIYMFDRVWSEAGLTCRAHPYVALPTSSDSGLLEWWRTPTPWMELKRPVASRPSINSM